MSNRLCFAHHHIFCYSTVNTRQEVYAQRPQDNNKSKNRMAEKVDINIEKITKWIQDEKCILILGPDIVFDCQKSLLNELSSFLINNEIECKFDANDELFSSNTDFDYNFWDYFSEFFDKILPQPIYQKIAEIPFNLIISLSPDLLIKQIFEKNNFDFTFDYYNRNLNPQEINEPTKEKPLIYNILGNYKEFDSAVLCFQDVYNYLSAILGMYQLSQKLKRKISISKSVLFLGFRFDKWYFKLILQLLNLDVKAIKQASVQELKNFANEPQKQNLIVDFYQNEFKILFIKQEGNEIIDLLHNYYKQNDLLRKPRKDKQIAQQITNIINVNDSTDVTILQNVDANNLNINKDI